MAMSAELLDDGGADAGLAGFDGEEPEARTYSRFAIRSDNAKVLFSMLSSIYDLKKDHYAVMTANVKGKPKLRLCVATPAPAPDDLQRRPRAACSLRRHPSPSIYAFPVCTGLRVSVENVAKSMYAVAYLNVSTQMLPALCSSFVAQRARLTATVHFLHGLLSCAERALHVFRPVRFVRTTG
jgi:hypothetical protein